MTDKTRQDRYKTPGWSTPGRYFCTKHRTVIDANMPGCPRCLADQQQPKPPPPSRQPTLI